MLKIASRSRSDVGRIALEEGPFRFRPRNFPPTMRMQPHLRGVRSRAAFLLLFHLPRAGGEEGEEREALPNSGLLEFVLEDLKSGEPDFRREAADEGRGDFCGGASSGSLNGAEKSVPASRSIFSPICSRSTRVFTSSTAAGASSPSRNGP